MTPENAQTILGVPRTAKKKAIEQAYHKRCKDLQLKMRPGNLLAVRKQAQVQLVQVTEAWNVLNQKPVKRSAKPAPKPQPVPRVTRHPTSHSSDPLNLAGVWERVFALIPLPRPVVATVAAATMLALIILLITII